MQNKANVSGRRQKTEDGTQKTEEKIENKANLEQAQIGISSLIAT